MRNSRVILIVLLLLSGALCSALMAGGVLYFRQEGPLLTKKILIIPAGSSAHTITTMLEDEGIIRHPSLFWFFNNLLGQAKKLKAGEYLFTPAMSPYAITDMLVSGRAIVHRFIVPEGISSAQILDLLNQEESLLGDVSLETIKEGELLPDTYFFSYGEYKQTIVNKMRRKMQLTLEKLWSKRQEGLPLSTPEEAVILASIVEKETGRRNERSQVAAVFINRLRKNMKLQSDPTVIYAITQGKTHLNRSLTYSDLRIKSPFNTYFVDRLPQAPISNPGAAAIEAVLNPATTSALYFVADGKGGHRFADTLKEHNDNVVLYRSFLQQVREENE